MPSARSGSCRDGGDGGDLDEKRRACEAGDDVDVTMTLAGERRTVAPVDATQALSALARDAIDLFTGPLRQRVRSCAAEDCELLFVDASRPGRRRWCSLNRCGSREKMRRYRAP
jgi:predicted RNA-binding Zn ribbon-like protein